MPTERDKDRRRRWLVAAVLAAVVLFGFWLRAANLGGPSLDIDEYLHVFAAKALLAGGEPVLPSGMVYTRALVHTWTVAASFALLGVSEASARVPSLVAGMLLILLTFGVGRRWVGTGPAVVAAALVAVFPAMVDLSRFCRMYAAFQVVYLGAAFAYDSAFEREGVRRWRRVAWAVAFLVLLAASKHMHDLAALMIPAIVAYWLGPAALRPRSRYGLYLLAVVVALGVGMLTGLVDPVELWARAHRLALWAEPQKDDVLFYVKEWNRALPWIWWLAVPATALLCWWRGRVGYFVACQFWVPFLLFSLVLPQKYPRYVAHLFPFLALILAVPLWEAVRWSRPTGDHGSRRPWRAAVAHGTVLVLLAAATLPALRASSALHDEGSMPRWREVFDYLRTRVGRSDALVVSVPLSSQYYLPDRDAYVMNNFFLDPILSDVGTSAPGKGLYSGLPVIDSLERLERVIGEHRTTWIASNRHHFYAPAATPWGVRRYVEHRCTKHWVVRDESVLVFTCPGPAPAGGAREEGS